MRISSHAGPFRGGTCFNIDTMASLSELLRQSLAVAVVSAAATTSAPAMSLEDRQIAQRPSTSPQSGKAVKTTPRPSAKPTSTSVIKGKPAGSKQQSGGCAPDQGGCAPAQ